MVVDGFYSSKSGGTCHRGFTQLLSPETSCIRLERSPSLRTDTPALQARLLVQGDRETSAQPQSHAWCLARV